MDSLDKYRPLAKRLGSIALIIIILYLIGTVGVAYVFGVETPFMVVVSRSMEPTINVNDIIVVRAVDPQDIEVGDIIVFKNPMGRDIPIVHRVVDIVELPTGDIGFITKGDNNPVKDPWVVSEEMVIGEVIYVIPQIGYLSRILNESPLIRFGLIALIVLVLVYLEYRDYRREIEAEESVIPECVSSPEESGEDL